MIKKVDKPVDRLEWGMTPPTVNAYYNPTFNEIVFPAGILQFPFFDKDADDAINYGAIGAVIGHEMTHGFDDQGRQYDKDGNLKDWWTAADAANYEQRDKCITDEYTQDVPEAGVKQNGKLSAGEDTAGFELNVDARTQYDTAKRFIQQSDGAIRAKNLVFAKNLADKAAALAAQLAGK